MERGTVRVKSLAQEHNTMTPGQCSIYAPNGKPYKSGACENIFGKNEINTFWKQISVWWLTKRIPLAHGYITILQYSIDQSFVWSFVPWGRVDVIIYGWSMFFINYLNICFLGLIKYKIWNCINLPFVMCFLPFRSLQFKNLWSYKISSLCKGGWNFFLAFYYTHGWWWWNIFFLFLDSWKSTVVHTCNLKFTLLICKIHVDFLSCVRSFQ